MINNKLLISTRSVWRDVISMKISFRIITIGLDLLFISLANMKKLSKDLKSFWNKIN